MNDDFTTPPADGTPPTPYTEVHQGTPYTGAPPAYVPPPSTGGLSDSAAGAIAYLTFIPAVIFLLIEPYKYKPFVKFHAIQEIGLTIIGFLLHFFLIIPFLGLLIWVLGWITLIICWILCILKASQGGSFKLPLIGQFAAEQSGFRV